MSDPFKFFSLEKLQSLSSPIVTILTGELVQDIAETDCGGRLSDEELEEFSFASREWCYDQLVDWVCETIPLCRVTVENLKKIDRQMDDLVARGKSDSEIAKALHISEWFVGNRRRERQTPAGVCESAMHQRSSAPTSLFPPIQSMQGKTLDQS